MNQSVFLLVTSFVNTATDFGSTVLPAFVVAKLHMLTKQKIAVSSLFLFGIIVNIASALRIYSSYVQGVTGDTWDDMPPSVCGSLEVGLGMVGIRY